MYLVPVIGVYLVWGTLMTANGWWDRFQTDYYMSITMVFGSFIAGATPEGGGAVAYPVMTLLYAIPPAVARNFSLAIQSIGMSSASLWILAHKVRIEKTYLWLVMGPSLAAVVFSSYFIAPHVAPDFATMMFVSFWLAFGMALFYVNQVRRRDAGDTLPLLTTGQKAELMAIGFVGGCFSGVLGNGVDIVSFSYVTMKYGLSEKVATPTSVVLMASNAVLGTLLHFLILRDVTAQVVDFWMVCIPIVVLGAPFGAYFATRMHRLAIAWALYVIIVVQFVSALIILKPTGVLVLASMLTFAFGIAIFFLLTLRQGGAAGQAA